LTDDVDEQEMRRFEFAPHEQIAAALPSTLRIAEELDYKLRRALESVDVLTAAITMIRESLRCQERGRT
jgi:hypothetical protein